MTSLPPSQPPPGFPPEGGSGLLPPSPDPPKRGWLARAATGLAWYLAISLVALPMGIAYLRQSGDASEAYAVGYAFGTGFATLLIAAIAQALHRRLTYRAEPAPLPLFLGACALLAIGTQFALRAADDGGVPDEVLACQESDPEPFGRAPSGMTLAPVSHAVMAEFEARAQTSLPAGLSADSYDMRVIAAGGRPYGAAVAAPGPGSSTAAMTGFGQGVMRDLVAAGGTVRTIRLGEEDGLIGRTEGVSVAVGRNGCWGVAVFAPDEPAALTVGRSILTG